MPETALPAAFNTFAIRLQIAVEARAESGEGAVIAAVDSLDDADLAALRDFLAELLAHPPDPRKIKEVWTRAPWNLSMRSGAAREPFLRAVADHVSRLIERRR
jgi:hypothetical protein